MQRITEFEGLRAILAWWVVWGHMLQYCGFVKVNSLPFYTAWLLQGGYAVDVFIILSGFVIFLLLDISSGKKYFQFLLERFFRIYPLFMTAFIAAAVLTPLKIFVFNNGNWHDATFVEKMMHQADYGYRYFIPHIIAHLTLLHGLIPDQVLPESSVAFLAPAWSLSLEWQFYLVAPLLLFCFRRFFLPSLSIALGVVLIGYMIIRTKVYTFGYGAFLPLKFDFFLVGIASYYIYKFSYANPKLVSKFLPFTSVLLITLAVLLRFFPIDLFAFKSVPLVIWIIALSSAIATATQTNFPLCRYTSLVLNSSALQNLGRVSYTTYLSHLIVLWVVMYFIIKFIPDANQDQALILLGSIGSLAVVGVSFSLFACVEKPFIGLGKRVSKKMASKAVLT